MLAGLGPLLASLAAMDAAAIAQRLRRNAILYALILLFVLTAYGTLVAAGALWIAERLGAIEALLVVTGGALFLALIVFLIAKLMARAEEKRKRQAAATSGSRALMMTAAVSALPVLIRSKPLALLAVAGGLGFLAMKNIGPAPRRPGDRFRDQPPPRP